MFDWITNLIETLGYIGITILMFFENLFPPIPSEIIMPLAGFLAAQGRFSLVWVVAAGTLGSLIGAYFWYFIGQKLGKKDRLRRFASRHGRWLAMCPEDIDKASDWFQRHGRAAIFFSRLVPGARTLISVPAGVAGMNLLTFSLYTIFGTALWTLFLTACGYVLEQNYERVQNWLDPVTWVVVIGFSGFYLYKVITFKPDTSK
jgi:membrane protein DedA with SNARE-associated domain